jgi:transcription antitermination factor NusG
VHIDNPAVFWKAVYIASRQEKKVAERLTTLGIEHYLPMSKKLRIWSDRKKWVDFPMFNGYLFVKPDLQQLDQVLNVAGVVSYLSFGGRHAQIRDREIEIIRSVESSGYHAESVHTPADFKEGEELFITEGPLKSQKVTLLRKNNEHWFLVSIESIGQSLKITLPWDVLTKTSTNNS